MSMPLDDITPTFDALALAQPLGEEVKQSAAQQALSIPLIISEIMAYVWSAESWVEGPRCCIWPELQARIDTEEYECGSYEDSSNTEYLTPGVLLRCILVCKLWYDEGITYLWKELPSWDDFGDTLTRRLSCVAPEHRQIFANMVEAGKEADESFGITNRQRDRLDKCGGMDEILRGLVFPKLRYMFYDLWSDPYLPKIDGSHVDEVVFRTHYEVCYPQVFGIRQDQMEELREQVVELFPNVKKIEFMDRCLAYEGSLKLWKEQIPTLEKFDCGSVVETDEWEYNDSLDDQMAMARIAG